MNRPLILRRPAALRALAALTIAAAVFPAVPLAQVPATPSAGGVAKTDKQARSDAKTLASNGQLAAAESELAARGKFAAGTEHWHFETGQSLTRLAADLGREGKATTARSVAALALQRFEQAATAAKDNRAKAVFKAAAGHVNERFLGDTEAAIASYRAAAQANPDDKGVRERLTRLENSYAVFRARVPANKR